MEELTWRLQLEKRPRTDLEETKTQEISKLQDTLHAMQVLVEEANAKVIKERKAAGKAIEEAPPVIKETPVQDTHKVDSLTAEVEGLKTFLLLRKEEERKDDQLQDSVQRFEEKLSNVESENQVLCKQALAISPTSKSLAARQRTTIIQGLCASPQSAGLSLLNGRFLG